jgi:hypothetical protein
MFFVSKNFYRKLFVKKRVILDRGLHCEEVAVGCVLDSSPK